MSTFSSIASTAAPSRFRCQDQMAAAAGNEGMVQLHFRTAATDGPVNLYAHKSFLRCFSGVLRGLLGNELATTAGLQPAAQVHKVEADSTPGAAAAGHEAINQLGRTEVSGCTMPVIPMPDEDPESWEDVLGMVYPFVPGVCARHLKRRAAPGGAVMSSRHSLLS